MIEYMNVAEESSTKEATGNAQKEDGKGKAQELEPNTVGTVAEVVVDAPRKTRGPRTPSPAGSTNELRMDTSEKVETVAGGLEMQSDTDESVSAGGEKRSDPFGLKEIAQQQRAEVMQQQRQAKSNKQKQGGA